MEINHRHRFLCTQIVATDLDTRDVKGYNDSELLIREATLYEKNRRVHTQIRYDGTRDAKDIDP